ncbi:MAG: glutamate-1-semialdehyde 2,1-aminomutase [Alphaproteobacteria bacterium]|nr:glutamate-1-semialdehyde 2,1-aminomutase [Alphaproteobacteria bacterium]
MKFDKTNSLSRRAHELIPGGCHTYAKGDDQYPVLAPGFIDRGLGCHVWDLDGNEYIEYGMGLRAVTLGHCFPAVLDAVRHELNRGTNFNRPNQIEIECAEELLGMIEGAEMVKFCKDGSGATTAAMRLARAYTGRDIVAFCGDHPFFATNDWFIGATPMPAGIPEAIRNLSVTFRYNNIESVRKMFADHPGKIAAVILEPAKYDDPKDNYLHEVQRLCRDNGAVFVLDEMITGFRWHNGGAQKHYGVIPDLCTFGKALANGFSVSALLGKREIMELGGLYHDRERVFLLSTTHGAEMPALAAAIATMRVYQNEPVIEHLWRQGENLRKGAEQVIARHGLQNQISIIGKPCCMVFGTKDQDGKPSQEFRTLFLQETIKRGVMMTTLIMSYSHSDEDVQKTVDAIDGALGVYKKAMNDGVEKYLVGRPSQNPMASYHSEPYKRMPA